MFFSKAEPAVRVCAIAGEASIGILKGKMPEVSCMCPCWRQPTLKEDDSWALPDENDCKTNNLELMVLPKDIALD
jgi:hypothetical protein